RVHKNGSGTPPCPLPGQPLVTSLGAVRAWALKVFQRCCPAGLLGCRMRPLAKMGTGGRGSSFQTRSGGFGAGNKARRWRPEKPYLYVIGRLTNHQQKMKGSLELQGSS
ncbi:hypothetical protein NDU88_002795, partial [Pleurodeles waltl]